jgi:predicted metal-binding protein
MRRLEMVEKATLEKLFKDRGFPNFKWIEAKDIIVAQWVRFRCMFGCPAYGKRGTCPPNVPSIEECRQMISEYSQASVFHFEKKLETPEDRKGWSQGVISKLVELEREVFLSGYYKTFLLPFASCGFCEDCDPDRLKCKKPKMARPGADAMGIDVYATVRSLGFPIQVLKDYADAMNRYAFLLIE